MTESRDPTARIPLRWRGWLPGFAALGSLCAVIALLFTFRQSVFFGGDGGFELLATAQFTRGHGPIEPSIGWGHASESGSSRRVPHPLPRPDTLVAESVGWPFPVRVVAANTT